MAHQIFVDITTYLHDQFKAVVPSDVAVSIGEPPGGDAPMKYVAVAYGGADRPGIIGTDQPDEGQNTGEFTNEDASIWCTISTASGDQNAAAQMQATQDIYELLAPVVLNDSKLGGLLQAESYARLGLFEWYPEEGGSVATLFFTVEVSARWLQ